MSVKNVLWTLLFAAVLASIPAEELYLRTPRDTGVLSGENTGRVNLSAEFEPVYENQFLKIYFREDRNLLALEDLRNGYIWKTGLDIEFNKVIDDLIDDGADPLKLPPLELRLNTTYTGIANSLLSIEYFDDANNIKRVGSSAYDDVETSFFIVSQNPFKSRLTVYFDDIDLSVVMDIRVVDDELIFSIDDENITGEGLSRLAAIIPVPFMGASGGRQLLWDEEEGDFEIEAAKEASQGYLVIPDGSGALVRFRNNSTELSEYHGDVYGEDLSQRGWFRSYEDFSVPHKDTYMPLFGIVHGNNQNAFAAYAASAGEYLEIVAFPEENTTYYTYVYPRFAYNRLSYQMYNKKGDGYFRLLEERNHFDLEIRYRFLEGHDLETGFSANYSGIARVYREFLQENGALQMPKKSDETDIPIRIEFLMADVRDSIVGQAHEITTTITDVELMLQDLQASGVSGQISAGLLGYARGGTVLSKPGNLQLLPALGSKKQFSDVLTGLEASGVDVSFSRDYMKLSDGQIIPWGNAMRGASGWYNEQRTFQDNAPVNLFYFNRPEKSTSWILSEADKMAGIGAGSLSIDGLGYQLFTDYSTNDVHTVTDTISMYSTAMDELGNLLEINMYRPNSYFWKFTDRFLSAPVFSTQFLLETDTIPLLQMVLHGTMDVFAPYANFSFNSNRDVLRMIDYNVYPSFIITRESSHLLLMTNSARFYSTEFANYRDIIINIYERVNSALKTVMHTEWLERRVLQDGVVVNRYSNGVQILINYTKNSFAYNGFTVEPENYAVVRSEGAMQ